MKKSHLPFLMMALFLLSGCEILEFNDTDPVGIVEGVRPIYAATETWDNIVSSEPRPIEFLGKIYYKDPFIYVNERNAGIHVIDNSDPEAPIPVRFIEVPGCEDIAIKGNILYADNITDLVSIDISNLESIAVTSRVKDLYAEGQREYPDGYSDYFECVDKTQGIVIGWEKVTLNNPTCFR